MDNTTNPNTTQNIHNQQTPHGSDNTSASAPVDEDKMELRSFIAFFLFGLCNNFPYIVMLTAAHDIMSVGNHSHFISTPKYFEVSNSTLLIGQNSTNFSSIFNYSFISNASVWSNSSHAFVCNPISTGAILLADVLPAVVIKAFAPQFQQHIPYAVRITLCVLVAYAAFLLVGLAGRSLIQALFGVVCASIAGGFGEATYLALTAHYPQLALSAWTSGTGSASLLASFSYALLAQLLTPSIATLCLACVPTIAFLSFFFILRRPAYLDSALPFDAALRPLFNSPSHGDSSRSQIIEQTNSNLATISNGTSVSDSIISPHQSTFPITGSGLDDQFSNRMVTGLLERDSPPSNSMNSGAHGSFIACGVEHSVNHDDDSLINETQLSSRSAFSISKPFEAFFRKSVDLVTFGRWNSDLNSQAAASASSAVIDPAVTIDTPKETLSTQYIPTWRERATILKGLLRFIAVLFTVYYVEYLINQGLSELIIFRDSAVEEGAQYRWYQFCFRFGVFVARCSILFIHIRLVYIFPPLQIVNLILLLLQIYFQYIPSISFVFAIMVWEGLIGGATYANVLRRISNESEPQFREYSIASVTFADAVGIALAGVTAMPTHNGICSFLQSRS